RDHLDYHGTLDLYRDAKLGLCRLLKPAGTAVVNADDSAWSDVRQRAERTLSFGIESQADVVARNVVLGSMGSRFSCEYESARVRVELPLLGGFNVQNALAATAAVLSLGMTLEEAAAQLARVPQVLGRLERIASTPCPVLRDYAHTPDALQRALAALRPLTAGRLIVVFGAGGDRDRGKRPLMAAAAQQGADLAIVTSDNPRTEDPEAILDEIVAGMTTDSYTRIADRRAAIAHALELGRRDDVILLAGKGHENYQILGTRKYPFDERVVVRELLGREAAGAEP
ncbi:MAG: Mur ligase family protein, partial [Longimicrobiales bacterium]